MPDLEPSAVQAVPEAVAKDMTHAADEVGEAAEKAAEEGEDALALKLGEIETMLRGHLQHHADEDAAISEAEKQASATVEPVVVDEPIVRPKKVGWYQRTRFL